MKQKLLLLFALAALLALPRGARADSLTLSFDQSAITVAPGTLTVPFFGAITNPSATDTIFLNSPAASTISTDLSVDVSPFALNAPASLAPGASSGDIELFVVDLDPATPIGMYGNNNFQIQGGPDGGAFTDFNDLVDASFEVDVQTPTGATVPEPATLWTVLTGLLLSAGCLALTDRRRKSVAVKAPEFRPAS